MENIEQSVRIPFVVAFMRIFSEPRDANELLHLVTNHLIDLGCEVLKSKLIVSEPFPGRKQFTLCVAWKDRGFGFITQISHSGFQLTYYHDPYNPEVPSDDPRGRGAIHGGMFKDPWMVTVPVRLTAIRIE